MVMFIKLKKNHQRILFNKMNYENLETYIQNDNRNIYFI